MPIANVAQYRKSIGTYSNKPRPASDKSIRKAIRKARRSHESISTRSNNCNTTSNHGASGVRALLMVGLAASLIGTSAAMASGKSVEKNELARATFPYLGRTSATQSSYCSSVRLNSRQVLTAKHCVENDDFRPWSWTNNWWGWDWAAHQLDYPDKNVDLSILTFDTDLLGETYCLPIMSKKTQKLLKKSAIDACGQDGPIITLGNGVSENSKCLHSAVFNFAGWNGFNQKNSAITGLSLNNKPAYSTQGDSGGAVMGCNPKTGGYELMGITSSSTVEENKFDQLTLLVDLAYYSEIGNWVKNNTKQYACSEEIIKSVELYDHRASPVEKCNGDIVQYTTSVLTSDLMKKLATGTVGLGLSSYLLLKPYLEAVDISR